MLDLKPTPTQKYNSVYLYRNGFLGRSSCENYKLQYQPCSHDGPTGVVVVQLLGEELITLNSFEVSSTRRNSYLVL